MTTSGPQPAWDYTHHARFYEYRPNYERGAIAEMLETAGVAGSLPLVADVGAGTGNLTLLLLERGLRCVAVEPNRSMREIGVQRTRGQNVVWLAGTGEDCRLAEESVDLFAMGSSFNTTDREATLREAHRVLRGGGWFACMWNHRDVEGDAVQARVEAMLRQLFPGYEPGTRRQDQSDLLKAAAGFEALRFIERAQEVVQPLDAYVAAWKSVKNRFWDLGTSSGTAAFRRFEERMRAELPTELTLTYTTRIWMVRKA